ncbi:MAG: class B sortase [Coriobacteriia bacterium]|nr:class B sortase [Coriobacteriia bacterium]
MNKTILRILLWVALAISLIVLGYSGYTYVELQRVYAIADNLYDEIRDFALYDTEEVDDSDAALGIPPKGIDWDALWEINEDTIGWLYSPNTPIDYPVMRADDYTFYLSRLPDRSFNANGSLFLDYNHNPDFSSSISVIYGHHMRSGSMFGTLENYRSQSFFDDHPVMYLYTPEQNFRIDLMYGFVVAEHQWRARAFMFYPNLPSLREYAAENTTFNSDVTFEEGDRMIALSTCSYDFDGARYVVLGIRRP